MIEEFADRGISGVRDDRPDYQRLLAALGSGAFDIVLTESLDRISRAQEDAAYFFKRARHADVRIHAIDQGTISALHVGFFSTMSALFLDELAAKTRVA